MRNIICITHQSRVSLREGQKEQSLRSLALELALFLVVNTKYYDFYFYEYKLNFNKKFNYIEIEVRSTFGSFFSLGVCPF